MRETLTSQPRVQQLRDLLGKSILPLDFEPALEHGFRQYLRAARLRTRWQAMLIGIVLPFSIVIADWLVMGHRLSAEVSLLLLGGICLPLAAISVARAFHRLQSVALTGLLYLHVGAVLVATTALSSTDLGSPPFLYVALLIHSSATYFASGMRLAPSCLIGFGILAGYLLTEWWLGLAPAALWESGLFLLAANLTGATGRGVMESLERRQFLSALLLEELATHDPLTGALNRVAFEAQMALAWRQAVRDQETVMLGVLDVDHFKKFNDRLGHASGDDLLVALAQCLRDTARRPLDLVSRFGGDEFVCLWYSVPPGGAQELLNSLHQTLNENLRICLPDNAPPVSVSLGAVAIAARNELPPASLFSVADAALYQAKEAGRNQAVLSAASDFAMSIEQQGAELNSA